MISDTPSAGWTSLDLNTRLRPCEPGDVPQITAIYAHAVRHGRASFELEPPDKTEMERRHHLLLQRYVEGLTPDGTADGQLFFIDVPDASTFKTKPLNFGV